MPLNHAPLNHVLNHVLNAQANPSLNPWLKEWAYLMLCFTLILLYQRFLAWKTKHNPAYTIQAVNRMARTAWVETVMQEQQDILAIQTLRNSTMAATFLASTAVLLIIGVLNLSGQGNNLSSTWFSLGASIETTKQLWSFKLLILLSDLFIAFFCFSMAIRIYTHVGYMINVPLNLKHKIITPAHVAAHLNRAGFFYSLGMRAYYFFIPLIFWLFSGTLMLLSTILLIIVLYFLDRTPETLVKDYIQE